MEIKRNVVIEISKLHLNLNNPRKGNYDREEMDELKESLKLHGQLTNIKVDENYYILGGHRRFQAAIELGWTTLRCDIYTSLSLFNKSAILISDNTTQKQFNPWECRNSINDIYWHEFCEEYEFKGNQDKGYTEFARKLGIAPSMVKKIIESMAKENLEIAAKLEKAGLSVGVYDRILNAPKKYRTIMVDETLKLIKVNEALKVDKSVGVRENLDILKKRLTAENSRKDLHPRYYVMIHKKLNHIGMLLTKSVINAADATEKEKLKEDIKKNILPAYKMLNGGN